MNGFCGNKACTGIIERRPVLNDLLSKRRGDVKPQKSNQTSVLPRNHYPALFRKLCFLPGKMLASLLPSNKPIPPIPELDSFCPVTQHLSKAFTMYFTA